MHVSFVVGLFVGKVLGDCESSCYYLGGRDCELRPDVVSSSVLESSAPSLYSEEVVKSKGVPIALSSSGVAWTVGLSVQCISLETATAIGF